MISAINEVIRAWQVYEGSVDWDMSYAAHPDMDTDEFYAVWNAMEALESAVAREEAAPGSTFAATVPAGSRVGFLGMAKEVLAAYRAFLDAGYPKNERYGKYVPFEPYARKLSEGLGVPFVGRHESGTSN